VALDEGKKIVGYAVGRRIHETLLVIAPIYAPDDTTARKLFLSLIPEHYSGRTVVFATSGKSENLQRELSEVARVDLDCTLVSSYTKAVPEVDIDRVYGMADLALGFI
uniref:YitH acetyltransferase (GNAT) domain-containing protein n=1 Tax=Plectus sambesii TaxID=2011161 RepID=A0A914UX65_9BILA